MKDIQKILVVTRSTQYCRRAIHMGISLAKKYAAEIVVLHVIHDPFDMKGWDLAMPYDESMMKEYKKIRKRIRKDLSKMIHSEKTQGLDIKELIKQGEPVNLVLKTIKQEKIDLLVMIAHHESFLGRLFFGDIIEKIIRKIPCSVFLVKVEMS
jgi:nucleotide-binding universal stress UspA family protein